MIDRFTFIPNNRQLKSTSASTLQIHGNHSPTVLDLLSTDPKSDWHQGSTTNSNRPGKMDTTRYHHLPTATNVWTSAGIITSVDSNLSRLYTGAPNNLYVLKSQEEIDAGLAKMHSLLDTISEGSVAGDFTALEIGGVINRPFTEFHTLLRCVSHPNTRSKPENETGLRWGKTSGNGFQISIYDKGAEFNRKRKRTPLIKLPTDEYTRIELKLSGNKLRKILNGGDPLEVLDFDQLYSTFFDVMNKFDSKVSLPAKAGDGSVTHLYSILRAIPQENRMINGVDGLDLWTSSKDKRSLCRLLKASREFDIEGSQRFLKDLLPDDGTSIFFEIPTDEPALDKDSGKTASAVSMEGV